MLLPLIYDYFPELTKIQREQYAQLESLYNYWNLKINVISRKDMDALYERHVLHSLGIAKVISFSINTAILDVGTGGGLPGIPLAILFPESRFHLIDSIGKKIKVVDDIIKELKLNNVTTQQIRAEQLNEQYDFVVSRAVTQLPVFLHWLNGKIKRQQQNLLDNGILYLKGGNVEEEIQSIKHPIQIFPLSVYFKENFFETKKVVHIKM